MSKKKPQFYYDGLFYSSEEEFKKAALHWANSEISPISASRILESTCTNIELNLFNLHGDKKMICNAEFQEMCERMSFEFIAKFRKRMDDQFP